MNFNSALADELNTLLVEAGFNVTIQRLSTSGGDFEAGTNTWTDLATVKAVWDSPRAGNRNMNDGAPASIIRRAMTVAYRADLVDTSAAVGLRVLVNGVHHQVISVSTIGEGVGTRLILEAGAGE